MEGMEMTTTTRKRPDHPAVMNKVIASAVVSGLTEADRYGLMDFKSGDDVYGCDFFAGKGTSMAIFESLGFKPCGFELEPEWAQHSPHVQARDALEGLTDEEFWKGKRLGLVVISPVYGNRISDVIFSTEEREYITYTSCLGRTLDDRNAGRMYFHNAPYQDLHRACYAAAAARLEQGGVFVLNTKPCTRNGELVPVTDWHREVLTQTGLVLFNTIEVPVRSMRYGQNHALRHPVEYVDFFRKPVVMA